jgi:ParB-like nuclease domain
MTPHISGTTLSAQARYAAGTRENFHRLSMAETNSAKWRRESVPARLREMGCDARSINAFGFNAPILIDKTKQIVAGHGRYEAAKLNGCTEVPVIWLEHLTEARAKAYLLADNKLTDRSCWDDAALATRLKELTELAIDFEVEDIGFELPEIDFRIQSLDATDELDRADELELLSGPAASRPGDLWVLGDHL